MIILEQMLAHLDGYEKKDFLNYVQQKGATKELLLTKLFLQNQKLSQQEIKAEIYGMSDDKYFKRDAYNSLRKQLTEHLIEWILIKRIGHDSAPAGKIFSLIMVAQFMIERNGVESAKYLLSRAEEYAITGRRYEILETIYSWLILHADRMGISAKEVIQRWEQNRSRYDQLCRLRNMTALQREQNQKAKLKGIALDPENSIQSIIKKVEISKQDANDPHIMVVYAGLFRAAIVTGKDYTRFENFVGKIYRRLKSQAIFKDGDKEFELELLFMHAHACYRNRKFEEAAEKCNNMEEIFGEKNLKLHPIYPRYMAIRAGIATFMGNNAEAIQSMEIALKNSFEHAEINEWLNMQLNLAVYYFQANQFKKSNKTLLNIDKNDQELLNLMGMEWCFKKKMIELIVQYELGNQDLSLKMVNKLRDDYSVMLSHEMYKRADIFLNLVLMMLKNPQLVTEPQFKDQVKNSRLAWPGQKEDVQAITFFCWLKSKMEKRDYYEVLLERMSE